MGIVGKSAATTSGSSPARAYERNESLQEKSSICNFLTSLNQPGVPHVSTAIRTVQTAF